MGPKKMGFDFGSAWAAWCGPGGPGAAWWGAEPGERDEEGRRRRRRGRRGPGRVFDRGDLKYVVLRLLSDRPMHGYEVMQALEQEAGGWYSASPGSVYPVLQMLEDQGYVTAEERDGKRVYRVTAEGRRFLERNSDRVEDVMDRVARFASRFSGAEMGDLTRSFVKLAQASLDAAMRGAGDAESMAKLKEILERAAREVREARGGGA
jgi:DNA-binding PadR family transcriptional regulator